MKRLDILLFTLLTLGIQPPVYASSTQNTETLAKFIDLLNANSRDAAQLLVEGDVTQALGSPGAIANGMYAGTWQSRVIKGRDILSVSEAFGTFSLCKLSSFTKMQKNSEYSYRVLVQYRCEGPRIIYFYADNVLNIPKVKISRLGQAMMSLDSAGKTVLWGFTQ